MVYFISPENFNDKDAFEFCMELARMRCISIAIDEVHKVTEWGVHFVQILTPLAATSYR